jgi:hypothetical protein
MAPSSSEDVASLDPQEPLRGQAVRQLVEEGRQVVHARDERDSLLPGPVLGVLLDAGVQVPHDRLAFDDGLAIDGEEKAQDAVGGGMLGSHVDHQEVPAELLDRGAGPELDPADQTRDGPLH